MQQKQLYRRVGTLLRERRKTRLLTQEALSQQMKISRAALANIEAGRQQVLVHQLYAAALALDCPVASLLPTPDELASSHSDLGMKLPTDLSEDQREQIMRLINSAERK
jgi:transcriptional regulator with XRE-family HTH domain